MISFETFLGRRKNQQFRSLTLPCMLMIRGAKAKAVCKATKEDWTDRRVAAAAAATETEK